MIVRLKVDYDGIGVEHIAMFQFYDSPIKRYLHCFITNSEKKFQFYDSPIKRLRFGRKGLMSTGFQFYDSPIKRRQAAHG